MAVKQCKIVRRGSLPKKWAVFHSSRNVLEVLSFYERLKIQLLGFVLTQTWTNGII